LSEWLAGAGGFEPPYGGIKIHCLTTWRRPNDRKPAPCKITREFGFRPSRSIERDHLFQQAESENSDLI
jgi:hypothetical protein